MEKERYAVRDPAHAALPTLNYHGDVLVALEAACLQHWVCFVKCAPVQYVIIVMEGMNFLRS